MIINRNTIQLTLVLIGFTLIFLTYFLYPTIKKNKFEEEILQDKEKLTTEKKVIDLKMLKNLSKTPNKSEFFLLFSLCWSKNSARASYF